MASLSAVALWEHRRADLERRRLSPRTISAHRHALFDFWGFLGKPPHRARPEDLDRYLARPAHPRSAAKGPALSAGTQHAYASIVCGFYQWAARARLIRPNRFDGYVLPEVEDAPPRDLALQLVRRVLEAAAGDDHLRVMLLLGYGMGMRAGEIARARLEDVQLHADAGGSMVIRGSKGSGQKVNPLTPVVEEYLRELLPDRPHRGPLVESLARPGRHVRPDRVSKLIGQALRAAGAPRDVTAHTLRHTFATLLLEEGEGENLRAVQRLLRHKSIRSTEVYTKRYDGDAWAAARRLPNPRKPKKATVPTTP